jgi:type I restriction enzyme S subunit
VNVQWGRIYTDDLLTMEIPPEQVERFTVRQGDLLVCEGGEIGRAAIWNRPDTIAYQKALHRVRSKGQLVLAYLRYLLEFYSNSGLLARFATGSTIAHLPQEQLRALPVPLPPAEEQRRIVEILEDHLSRLDAGAN